MFVVEVLMDEAGDGGVLKVEMAGVGCVGRLAATKLLYRGFLAVVRVEKLVGWC